MVLANVWFDCDLSKVVAWTASPKNGSGPNLILSTWNVRISDSITSWSPAYTSHQKYACQVCYERTYINKATPTSIVCICTAHVVMCSTRSAPCLHQCRPYRVKYTHSTSVLSQRSHRLPLVLEGESQQEVEDNDPRQYQHFIVEVLVIDRRCKWKLYSTVEGAVVCEYFKVPGGWW